MPIDIINLNSRWLHLMKLEGGPKLMVITRRLRLLPHGKFVAVAVVVVVKINYISSLQLDDYCLDGT